MAFAKNSQVYRKQTNLFLLNHHHPRFVSTTTTNNHYLLQPFDHLNNNYNVAMPRRQRNGRKDEDRQMDGDDSVNTSFRQDEDDLACQRTCHIVETVTMQVVVTVHMNSGKLLFSSLSFCLFTRKAGATSPTATWQPITDARQQQ